MLRAQVGKPSATATQHLAFGQLKKKKKKKKGTLKPEAQGSSPGTKGFYAQDL